MLGRLESSAERWQAANIRHRDGLVLPKGLLLTEAVDLMRRWGTELPGAVLDFIKRSRSVAKRRRMRMALAMSGAIVLLPVIAAIVWTIMVWRGVQAVEGTMAFVQIPKGCFEMGAPLGEEGRFDHETPHNVCVSAFELGKYAITQDEWRQVMVESPDPARYKGGRNPIEMISWHDARSFTRRMNLFGKHQYRLPTEAEWEYAARAGTSTTWFWGNKLEDGCGYANLRDLSYERERFNVGEAIIGCADGSVETAPVGSYKPNAFGLYDMTGNVFQWIDDCFDRAVRY